MKCARTAMISQCILMIVKHSGVNNMLEQISVIIIHRTDSSSKKLLIKKNVYIVE